MGYKATVRAMEAANGGSNVNRNADCVNWNIRRKNKQSCRRLNKRGWKLRPLMGSLKCFCPFTKSKVKHGIGHRIAAALPPPSPQRSSRHEQKGKQRVTVLPAQQRQTSQFLIEEARLQDDQEFQRATQAYSEQMAEWEKLKNLALRILAGEHKAYTEALVELNPFAEMSDLGSAIHFTVHTAKLAECVLKINGTAGDSRRGQDTHGERKSFRQANAQRTLSRNLSGYICLAVCCVWHEKFLRMLPVDALLVTAAADMLDSAHGSND